MPTRFALSEAAIEQGTYSIDVSFTDEAGEPVTPNAGLKWSLVKSDRATIVNAREDVDIAVPASTVTVILSGADLTGDTGRVITWRYLVIEGTYDGSLGTDLPIKDHVQFPIVDVAKVPL